MHDLPLLNLIAAAFTAAWILGIITQKMRLSPIVGYLLAGIVIGPYTPGFVGDTHLATQLAEVGVILLMFGVGLHFHLGDLLAVKRIAVPGAIGQSVIATLFGVIIALVAGWGFGTGVVFGIATAVASTVVLMRVLMDNRLMDETPGHVAVGWLIVEDILTIIVLVTIPAITVAGAADTGKPASPVWISLGIALLKLAALVAILLIGGSKVVPWMLVRIARLRSRELFTLTVLVLAIAVATGSAHFFGASYALGAFLAGMVVGQSPVSQQAAADALPMRDAFAVLFFVSVGMLFDPLFAVHHPILIAAALAVVLIVKPLAAFTIVVWLGHPVRTALVVALGLAQIGEFSFILSELGRKHGLMNEAGYNVLVAAAIISITINPLLFRAIDRIEAALCARPALWAMLNRKIEARQKSINLATVQHIEKLDEPVIVVIGYGPVGRSIDHILRERGLPTTVIDLNMDAVTAIKSAGRLAIFGDASNLEILEQAGVKRATHLIITLPHSGNRIPIVTGAKQLNSNVTILVRARYLREREDLERAGADVAIYEETEASVSLVRALLAEMGEKPERIAQQALRIRRQFAERAETSFLG